jgi:large subunit ribosomal protein L19
MKHPLLKKIEESYLRKDPIPDFRTGDTVRVVQKVTEGAKTRSQSFEGVVIARNGSGITAAFTVRRISFGEGVEKTYPVHSPTVQSVTVTRRGKVRKSKLYYLRKKSGKQGRIEEAELQDAGGTPAGGPPAGESAAV